MIISPGATTSVPEELPAGAEVPFFNTFLTLLSVFISKVRGFWKSLLTMTKYCLPRFFRMETMEVPSFVSNDCICLGSLSIGRVPSGS